MKLNLGASDRHLDGFLCVDIAPQPCAVCDAPGHWSIGPGKPEDRRVDLTEPWPWADSSIEEVMALDVVEHIGIGYRLKKSYATLRAGNMVEMKDDEGNPIDAIRILADVELVPFNGKVHFFNELHRVLQPGGRVTIETPDAAAVAGEHPMCAGAGYFQDPTHVSPYTMNSFQYVGAGHGGDFAYGRLSAAYGIVGRYKLIDWSRRVYKDVYDSVVKLTVILEVVKP